MPLQFKPHGRARALALASLVSLATGLSGPATASAMRDAASVERHAKRVEERAERRAERREEAEARRKARAELRAARRLARQERLSEREKSQGSGSGEGSGGSEAGTPTAGEDAGCLVTLAAGSRRVLAGETVSLSGSVTCATPLPASASARLAMVVYEHTAGSPRGLVALGGTLTPTDAGTFSTVSGPLESNTVFAVRLGRAHARIAVKVAPKVTLSATPVSPPATTGVSAASRRAKTTFSGTVTPAVVGSLVTVQVSYAATGEHWRSIASARTDSEGAYSIEHALRLPGVTAVRSIVHGGRHLVLGVSETLSLEGSQPQNPKLTVAASSDPLVAGQHVVISGVATGESRSAVKLLARRAAGWTTVGEATTDQEGAYSFDEQAPTQTTLYRVTDATQSSTTLHEVVAFAISPEAPSASAVAGQPVTFGGQVTPATTGQRVMLEQRSGASGGYQVIATGTVGAPPTYSVTATFAAPGSYVLRVRVPSDGAHRATTSAPFELTVAAPSGA
jgi:hypothetical protein